MRRVQVDGRFVSKTLPNGNVLEVDSRQYVTLDSGGHVWLDAPDNRRVELGYERDLINDGLRPEWREYFSPEKFTMVDAGIRELLTIKQETDHGV